MWERAGVGVVVVGGVDMPSFGHTGRGGSLGFADPEHGIAFGYVMNHIIGGADDVRAASLVDAVRKSLR